MDTTKRSKAAKSKFREPGGEAITLIVPRDFNLIAKGEAKSSNRGAGGSKGKNNRKGQSNIRNRSQVFKQFLKYLLKPSKTDREKIPSTRLLMQQREYVEYERKKDVTCEIIPIDIKSANNDSLKCLVFKIGKLELGTRKNQDQGGNNTTGVIDNEALLGIENMDFTTNNANGTNKHHDHFNFLKQATESTGQDIVQQHNYVDHESNEEPPMTSPALVKKRTQVTVEGG